MHYGPRDKDDMKVYNGVSEVLYSTLYSPLKDLKIIIKRNMPPTFQLRLVVISGAESPMELYFYVIF